MYNYDVFCNTNNPNVFDKRILKRLRKTYASMFWEDIDVTPMTVYHDINRKPVAWYDAENKWGYFPK